MPGFYRKKSKIGQMADLAKYFAKAEASAMDPPVGGVSKVQTPAQKMSVKKAAAASVAKRRSRMIGGKGLLG